MSSEEEYPIWYEPKFYKKQPKTLHEKYTEAWMHFSGQGLSKSNIQAFSNNDWGNASMDKKHELIKRHIEYVKSNRQMKSRSLFECGIFKGKVRSKK